jgi:hypothetical protein
MDTGLPLFGLFLGLATEVKRAASILGFSFQLSCDQRKLRD